MKDFLFNFALPLIIPVWSFPAGITFKTDSDIRTNFT